VRSLFIVGLCAMLPREVLNAHGLLDEDLELGADDLELSWRLTRLGYTLAIAADVVVSHVGGASFASLPEEEVRARVRQSDARLVQKLRAYYGEEGVPCAENLWGVVAFEETLQRDYGDCV
jgi:GT2 family glycosyltransferase